jgi:N-acetylglucosamine-6-phosphate deacetylase
LLYNYNNSILNKQYDFDLRGENIGPGFIDIQINGCNKFNFSESPTQNKLEDIY